MNAGGDYRAVDVGDDVERAHILTGHNLGNGFEAVLFVTRVDTLGRIADGEIVAANKTGDLLQHRHTLFLDSAGIDRDS